MAPGNVSSPRSATTIHEQFEAQATRSPDAIALVFEDKSLTYRELNAQANRLAHHLRALGVGADALVGVCLDRSLDAIVAMLAVLKAGGAFVPIDPTYPTTASPSCWRTRRPLVL